MVFGILRVPLLCPGIRHPAFSTSSSMLVLPRKTVCCTTYEERWVLDVLFIAGTSTRRCRTKSSVCAQKKRKPPSKPNSSKATSIQSPNEKPTDLHYRGSAYSQSACTNRKQTCPERFAQGTGSRVRLHEDKDPVRQSNCQPHAEASFAPLRACRQENNHHDHRTPPTHQRYGPQPNSLEV